MLYKLYCTYLTHFTHLSPIVIFAYVVYVSDMKLYMSDLFKDPQKIKTYLVQEKNVLTADIVDALLASELNISKVPIQIMRCLTKQH